MTKQAKRLSRRSFLFAVSGGAAAAAAIVVRTTAPPSPGTLAEKRDTRGYHVSEHINNYYRTAQV